MITNDRAGMSHIGPGSGSNTVTNIIIKSNGGNAWLPILLTTSMGDVAFFYIGTNNPPSTLADVNRLTFVSQVSITSIKYIAFDENTVRIKVFFNRVPPYIGHTSLDGRALFVSAYSADS